MSMHLGLAPRVISIKFVEIALAGCAVVWPKYKARLIVCLFVRHVQLSHLGLSPRPPPGDTGRTTKTEAIDGN